MTPLFTPASIHKIADPRTATAVDRCVGARIRYSRTMLGITQERLGELLGITFQQVQKYETGKNRVSASRLAQLSEVLGIPIGRFFEAPPRGASPQEIAECDCPTARQPACELNGCHAAAAADRARTALHPLASPEDCAATIVDEAATEAIRELERLGRSATRATDDVAALLANAAGRLAGEGADW